MSNINYSYILTLTNDEYKKLKEEIKKFIKMNNYEIENEINNDNIDIFKIKKNENSGWVKDVFYELNSNEKYEDTKKYRITIYKYNSNTYFFEKNGGIKIDDVVKKFNYDKITMDDWKKLNIEKNKNVITNLHNRIRSYFNKFAVNKIEENIAKINEIKNIQLNEDDYNLENILKMYDDLIVEKKIDNDNKLIDYNVKDCKTDNAHKKGDEGEYNKLACNVNNKKYICLDKILIDKIEIGDIYNIDKNIIYHNKKNGELRVLSSQITNSILMTRDNKKLNEYINNNNLNEQIDKEKMKKCEYVFGLIQENKNTSLKDKLSIGTTCLILNKMNIKYYSDCINFIKDETEIIKETKNAKSTLSKIDNVNEKYEKEQKNKIEKTVKKNRSTKNIVNDKNNIILK